MSEYSMECGIDALSEDLTDLKEKFKEAKEALLFISKIKNGLTGGLWDEIEIARGCAKTALDKIAPDWEAEEAAKPYPPGTHTSQWFG